MCAQLRPVFVFQRTLLAALLAVSYELLEHEVVFNYTLCVCAQLRPVFVFQRTLLAALLAVGHELLEYEVLVAQVHVELLHAVCQVRQSCLTDYTCVCVMCCLRGEGLQAGAAACGVPGAPILFDQL